ncbi:MAG: F0F1 ATP synthase subunit B [Planctomycetota bacterium]|nr:F0F1 ATP synthase subunit B [Planctomycetota bacterium]
MISAVISRLVEGGGFNPFEFATGATFWTWAIFLLSLPLMWKVVFGPITRGLAARDQQVVDAAASAEKARNEAEEAAAAARAELDKARADGRQRIQDAINRAEKQAQEAQREAKAEIERERLKASDEIEAAKQRALLEIRKEVVELTISSASRVLQKDLDADDHRRMVQGLLGEIEDRRN